MNFLLLDDQWLFLLFLLLVSCDLRQGHSLIVVGNSSSNIYQRNWIIDVLGRRKEDPLTRFGFGCHPGVDTTSTLT